ncbi:MAG: redoxin domain-containing protein, partial [Planctomycetota bacterium]
MTGPLLARSAGLLASSLITLSASSQVMLGAPAPTIDLEALENAPADLGMTAEEITWDALAGKTVVLEFWATWCGPCIAAIPHLNELAESYVDADDVIFLSVTAEPVELVNEFRAKREMKSWIGHDLDRDTLDAFDVRGIPSTILIHDGRVM